MRLIDADKLKASCVCLDSICMDIKAVENAPTVEAIPIDFIKQAITDKRYILARASEKTAPYYEHAVRALEMLLWEWGKENDKG